MTDGHFKPDWGEKAVNSNSDFRFVFCASDNHICDHPGETNLMCQNGSFHFFPEFCSLNPKNWVETTLKSSSWKLRSHARLFWKKYKILKNVLTLILGVIRFWYQSFQLSSLSLFLYILSYDSSGFEVPKLKIAFWKRNFKNHFQIQMNSSYPLRQLKKSLHQIIIQLHSHKTT